MKKVLLSAMVMLGVLALPVSCKEKQKNTSETVEQEEVIVEEESPEVPDMHNAETSLDFEGVYEGVIPCADCEGIKFTVTIHEDGTLEENSEYLGRAKETTFKDHGTWNIDESTLTFTPEAGNPRLYFVGEGFIRMLDQEGNDIEGDLADMYILRKK
ncbi:NlpE N-terminal domain-containing protein [Sinomicrobium oceani]|uniref:NlpE N-terminal domain-containing protein n=1 Tax=Sinomicrobium oceani TaxID=1150368 RepID=A0A1K1QXL1_9FLAO|nr:copper resistance protein NlpE [Sinomicrobium oceani]SFW64355.1 NlpE N-terminal domain-containing protein [Sinomicrobium oceani]